MAQKTIVTLVSDLSGDEIEDGGQTVEFALDGVTYEIDLNDDEANELRDQLAVYIENGRRTGGRKTRSAAPKAPSGSTTAVDREQSKAVRTWAKEHGYQVSDRGRIPSEVSEAYHQQAVA